MPEQPSRPRPTVGRIVHYRYVPGDRCKAALVVSDPDDHPPGGDPRFRARVFYPDGSEETLTQFVDATSWHWPEREAT